MVIFESFVFENGQLSLTFQILTESCSSDAIDASLSQLVPHSQNIQLP